ncbi:MAG: DNA repair helicase XPB [Planctomycetota bacterium]
MSSILPVTTRKTATRTNDKAMSTGSKPLVVQSDGTLLLEVHDPGAKQLRPRLAAIAQLQKSPEYFHEYALTPISLWNAAQSGWSEAQIIELLESNARYPVPQALLQKIHLALANYGRAELVRVGEELFLRATRAGDDVLSMLAERRLLAGFLDDPAGDLGFRIRPEQRGELKVAFIKAGFPLADRAGFRRGAEIDFALAKGEGGREVLALRDYQREAVAAFFSDQGGGGGSGVVVLPCGAGKTVVGIAVMAALRTATLILTPNITALRQWQRELLQKTTLGPEHVAEYSGQEKRIAAITIATYQVMSHRRGQEDDSTHLDLFSGHDWGLIVYDEVHLLPAPVFRFTADIQARRRLGLTATLVREDGREDEVFTLIGPRVYELPWRDLEQGGYIASVRCIESRVELPTNRRSIYEAADLRHRFRMSSENPRKLRRLQQILEQHRGERILIIGQYLRQLRRVAREIGAPLITGQTMQAEREELYGAFRTGTLPVLIVSKVGNFAVDLPDASVAVQISGTFGSRQEEAQRLGRILRPKSDGRQAFFYALVTRDSRDQDFASRRQRFLMEQGYHYEIQDADGELPPSFPTRTRKKVAKRAPSADVLPNHLRAASGDDI